jgi:DNA topoisomerase-1
VEGKPSGRSHPSQAKEAGVIVRDVDPAGPGLRRRRVGRGFGYLDERGRRITDPAVIERIKALAIPPAWTDVWICPDPRGHIQACGLDARGRRQYRYHDEWRARRDRDKHDRMLELARALPRLRRRLRRDLATDGLGRDRVLACAVRLLELGLFRVGGEPYVEENGSYGLATLRKRHVRAVGGELRFDYPGKGNRRRVVTIGDAQVADVVRALKRRHGGGPELLAYKDDRGRWVDVRSADINDYVQRALGPEFSAKDFRTWTATVLAAVALAAEEDVETERQRRMAVVRVVRRVALVLGNTPAVARGSYVDPRVIERYEGGETVGDALAAKQVDAVVETVLGNGDDGDEAGEAGDDGGDDGVSALDGVPRTLLSEIDAAVVDLIEGSPRRPARARRRR